jgi:hypothetical protein
MILVINTYVFYQTTFVEENVHKQFFCVFTENKDFVPNTI